MPRKAPLKMDAIIYSVPQSEDQAATAIGRIGWLQRQRLELETRMNEQITSVRKPYEDSAAPLGDEISRLAKGVQLWCEANRDTLTNGGKAKKAKLSTGEVGWRKRRGKLVLDLPEEVLVAALKKARLKRFVRVIEELDKNAILANPAVAEKIDGMEIQTGENFTILPFATGICDIRASNG